MAYRNLQATDKHLQLTAKKLSFYQRLRAYKLRKLYPKDKCPLLYSLSPLQLLVRGHNIEDYIQALNKLCTGSRARVEDYGSKWVFVAKQTWLKDNQPIDQAYKLANFDNIRVHHKLHTRPAKYNGVVNTRVLKYLLGLRGAGCLSPCPTSGFALSLLSSIARKALRLPFNAHIDTSLLLGLKLMGFTVLNEASCPYILGAKLSLQAKHPQD